jgi:hypothetical protein
MRSTPTARRVGEPHERGAARSELDDALRPRPIVDRRRERRPARRVRVVLHDDGGARRRLDVEARDREVVVGAADLHPVDDGDRVARHAGRGRREVGQHDDARARARSRLADRERDGRRERRGDVGRLERLEPAAHERGVGGPADEHVRALGGRDQHRLGLLGVDERAGAPACEVEPRAAVLARLHAGGEIEHEHERATRATVRRRDVRAQERAGEREEAGRLQHEEQVGPEAPPSRVARRRHLPPEQQAPDDDASPPSEQMERHQRRDGREPEHARGVEDADRAHRRRTSPAAASGPVTNAGTDSSAGMRA